MSNEAWLEGYTKGWYGGVAEGDKKVRVILTDLIADLRSDDVACFPNENNSDCIYCFCGKWPCDQEAAVLRAEAKLKELEE